MVLFSTCKVTLVWLSTMENSVRDSSTRCRSLLASATIKDREMSKRITLLLIFLLNLFISCSHDNRLVDAARDGQTDKIRQLLKDGEDVNEKDHDGKTALIWAAETGNIEILKLMLDANAD